MGTTDEPRGQRSFLVERYWPGISRDQLADAEERMRRALRELAQHGVDVRLVSTTFMPTEEVVLNLFEARHEDDVIDAHRRSGVRFDRLQPVEVSPLQPEREVP